MGESLKHTGIVFSFEYLFECFLTMADLLDKVSVSHADFHWTTHSQSPSPESSVQVCAPCLHRRQEHNAYSSIETKHSLSLTSSVGIRWTFLLLRGCGPVRHSIIHGQLCSTCLWPPHLWSLSLVSVYYFTSFKFTFRIYSCLKSWNTGQKSWNTETTLNGNKSLHERTGLVTVCQSTL